MSDKMSQQSHDEALVIAKGTQKPGQSKEQTKAIAAGIQKGIATYKKQHKAKMREQNKQRKKLKRNKEIQSNDDMSENTDIANDSSLNWLPWALLAVSWLIFITLWLLKL